MQMPAQPYWIYKDAQPDEFPDIEHALLEPNGLLAVGGDLSPRRLLCAYRRGIFPWFSDGQPILWWSPNPRAILSPDGLRVSRSLRKTLRKNSYLITENTAFKAVVSACAAPRRDHNGTWITDEMWHAYARLHELGHARSIECWWESRLVGGLYGVEIGSVFFGESMFSRMRDASKVALVHLCRQGYRLIDCQLPSAHLASLGATNVSRRTFASLLEQWCDTPRVRVPAQEIARRRT